MSWSRSDRELDAEAEAHVADAQAAKDRLHAMAPVLLQACRSAEQRLTELLHERALDSTRAEFYAVRSARDSLRSAIAEATGGAQ